MPSAILQKMWAEFVEPFAWTYFFSSSPLDRGMEEELSCRSREFYTSKRFIRRDLFARVEYENYSHVLFLLVGSLVNIQIEHMDTYKIKNQTKEFDGMFQQKIVLMLKSVICFQMIITTPIHKESTPFIWIKTCLYRRV